MPRAVATVNAPHNHRSALAKSVSLPSRSASRSASSPRRAHEQGVPFRKQMQQFADGEILGILLAKAHPGSSGKLRVDLVRGRTYLVICQIEDPQGMPRHNILGMHKTFSVR